MGAKILAVDDEQDILLIIKTALEDEGYSVFTSTEGGTAIELAKKEKPQAILLDIRMPEMNGFEVLKKLHDDDTTTNIPIIMLTGEADKDTLMKALNEGVNYYIVKPFDTYQIVEKVEMAIRESSAE